MNRSARAAALLGPAVLALAACGSDARVVSEPAPDPRAYPVVTVGQARGVLDAVEGALVRGVGPKDSAQTVDARLVGPFRELAIARARVAAERKREPAAPADVEQLRLIVPTSRAWPRFFVAVGKSSEASTYLLRVLTSAGPRSPYGLWAEPTMLPGATLPETAPAGQGTEILPVDAPGLVATPREVIEGYAGYLNAGAKTSDSRRFRRSAYSDQVLQRLAGDRKALKAVADVRSKHVATSRPPLALRTSDGGALVIGELEQQYVVTVKKGKGKVRLKDRDLAALAGGKKQFTQRITRTALEVLVFAVPPGGRGPITVVAAQKGDIKAVAT